MNPKPNDSYLQLILLLVFLIPAIFFLLTQQRTLKAIRPENRRMRPGLVWLQLIPLFGQVWQFFVVARIAGSLKKERDSFKDDSIVGFSDYTVAEEWGKRPTYAIGLTYCILVWCNILIEFRTTTDRQIDQIHGLIALAMMTCWIIYWVRLAVAKRKIRRSSTAVAAL
jgi:hypothetical protein